MVYIIPNFLSSTFWQNFHYDGKLKQQICYSFTLIILTHLKWQSSSFPNFDGSITFSPQIPQAPGPDFRKLGKSLDLFQ